MLDSILCKDGFIKTYSKPSNPGRAKNFTNPPDYQIYFDHAGLSTTTATGGGKNQLNESHSPPTKNKQNMASLTQQGNFLKDGSGSLDRGDSNPFKRPNSKLLGP